MSRLDELMSGWSLTNCSNSKVKPFFFLGSSECLHTPCEECVAYKPNLLKPVETLGGKDE